MLDAFDVGSHLASVFARPSLTRGEIDHLCEVVRPARSDPAASHLADRVDRNHDMATVRKQSAEALLPHSGLNLVALQIVGTDNRELRDVLRFGQLG
jgi:hypothetical protein